MGKERDRYDRHDRGRYERNRYDHGMSRDRNDHDRYDRDRYDRDRRDDGRRSRDRYGRGRDIDRASDRSRFRHSDSYDRKRFKFDSPPKQAPKEGFGGGVLGYVDGIPVQDSEAESTRFSRQLEISNTPPNIEVEVIIEYFNMAMLAVGGNCLPGNPAIRGKHNSNDKTSITIEMRTLEETSNALQLNGLNLMGKSLSITRVGNCPPEYINKAPPPTVPTISPSILALGVNGLQSADIKPLLSNAITSLVGGAPKTDRLLILDLPITQSEDQIKSMVEEFGKLKYIQLFKNADDTSAGMCLIEFVDTNVQVEALQKMRLQYNIILAEDALTKRIIDRNLLRLQMRNQSELMKTQIPTRCIIIRNLVTTASLQNDREYQEVIEDIRAECDLMGQVERVEVPRNPPSEMAYAFVLFESIQGAAMARKSLGGRRFASNVVQVDFYNEEEFMMGKFDKPEANYELAIRG
ncbi:Splicing factor U2af large subunit A [Babesia microti strain RI]|uniref:Splicing factor U2af large subunit A n=1 Tax=Babesia microti (strain RI) TaxID=1133968 RepID=A0A1N6LWL6_BABMR|nr:Splicing factor U2af large subunit A [Babesia microti strain RI]SIO73259.1 Splicing factor U2af large subunit A [Babesia microti strain RI]|eukprot:XP_021337365.1 Splicing factor U2af large subunit A [Babesia microti strain RI]